MPPIRFALLASSALVIAACSESDIGTAHESVTTVDAEAPKTEFGFWEAMEQGSASESAAEEAMADSVEVAAPVPPDSSNTIPVGLPQIAHRFAYGFRVPTDAIKPLQERHADMCEARGPEKCRIISMRQSDSEGDYGYASLHIAVAAEDARNFGKELEQASGSVDGELVSSSIDGEDLSKAIVDTEARLRARTLLRDRLMEVLRTRKGTVAELVQAERGVAQVNEEIDQAQSWLAEMRGRVAYSQMQITYETGSRSSGGFVDPIRSAFGSIGSILGNMIAFAIVALTILLPLGLLVWVVTRLWKRRGGSLDLGGWKPESKTEESKE